MCKCFVSFLDIVFFLIVRGYFIFCILLRLFVLVYVVLYVICFKVRVVRVIL